MLLLHGNNRYHAKEHEYQGTEIAAENTYRAELGLHLYGRSWQETTTGAQLLNWKTITSIYSNAITTIENNGYDITISTNITEAGSTTSPKYSNARALLPNTLAGKTVSWSYTTWENNVPQETVKLGWQYVIDGKNYYITTQTITIPENVTYIYLRFFLTENAASTVPVGTYTAKFTGVMLNYGDTALPWEPYTGGIPSPNPDYPQPINSIGDSGSVDVVVSDNNGNSQTLTINTPNGLCGIPVDTGGNYTDSTGQQWVCDEVDFERGVYVQRVKKSTVKTLDKLRKTNEQGRYANWNIFSGYASAKVKSIIAIASYFIWGFQQPLKWISALDTNGIYISPPKNTNYTVDTLKSYLTPLLPFEVCGILATPIETPLTEEELAAYKAIKSYPHYTHIKSAAELKVKLKIF